MSKERQPMLSPTPSSMKASMNEHKRWLVIFFFLFFPISFLLFLGNDLHFNPDLSSWNWWFCPSLSWYGTPILYPDEVRIAKGFSVDLVYNLSVFERGNDERHIAFAIFCVCVNCWGGEAGKLEMKWRCFVVFRLLELYSLLFSSIVPFVFSHLPRQHFNS